MTEPIILYEDEFLICVVKPSGIPTQPDKTGDMDMVTFLNQYLNEQKCKTSYIGLIHRLDRPVGGILIFSKKKSIDYKLYRMLQENKIKKDYLSVVCGNAKQRDILENYLLKNGKTNLSFVVDKKVKNAKKSVLTYEKLQMIKEEGQYYSLLKITLLTGRHHQIRVQLSYAGIPIWGDQKYNLLKKWQKGNILALWAYQLIFKHPITNKDILLKYFPNNEPFSRFTIFE